MLDKITDYQWVPLSEEERLNFIALAKNCPPQHPTLFNFSTDVKNCGGDFANLSQPQIVESAINSAKWLMAGAEA